MRQRYLRPEMQPARMSKASPRTTSVRGGTGDCRAGGHPRVPLEATTLGTFSLLAALLEVSNEKNWQSSLSMCVAVC